MPTTALAADMFDAAYFSIGPNATQSVSAAACDNDPVAVAPDLNRSAVERRIALPAVLGTALGRKESHCADEGGEAQFIEALLSDVLGMPPAPAALGRARAAIVRVDLPESAR